MVSRKQTTAIDSLNVERKLRKSKKPIDIQGSIAKYEKEAGVLASFEDAEKFLARKREYDVVEMSRGEMLLEAAYLGEIGVLKALENPKYRIDFVNDFNEGLLHFAAKGNKEKMVHYLLLRGLDPNSVNKFQESPIFIAAEMGSK